MSDSEQRILDGTAWNNFCDALKEAGEIVNSDKAPKDAFNRAEGYRYLTRLLRGGLESFLEHRDPAFPQLRCGAHETIKLGADNPDNRYESAPLNPQFDYRISGTRGSVDYLGLSTIINKYASGGTMEVTGHIDARGMDISPDGTVEIIISQREHSGNWLPMGPKTNSITVRQTFQDRIEEQRADLKIERIGAGDDRPEPLSAEKLERGLQGAVKFVKGSSQMFENWAESFLPTNNQLPLPIRITASPLAAIPISSTFTAPGSLLPMKYLLSTRLLYLSAKPGISNWITGGWNHWTIASTPSISTNTLHTTIPTAV